MTANRDKDFGMFITRLIQKENLSRRESKQAFYTILEDQTSELQQGAFLAALCAKGETEEEVAGSWEAIYELDTVKVDQPGDVLENSGTGMDSFKTFNISTAASIVAASGGVRMARHGARSITSMCGTVDMAERLGVDVECSAKMVADSVKKAGIGLFNGMSPQSHPGALGRILSKIHFGSTLNIAASLANPVMPRMGVRGVYSREMILPVTKVMKAIGYKRALVFHGAIDNSQKGMDEASVCGPTFCAELKENQTIAEYAFRPEDLGLKKERPELLAPSSDLALEARDFVSLFRSGKNGARAKAVALNAGLIFYVAEGKSMAEGVQKAESIIQGGAGLETIREWVEAQNRNPEKGMARLNALCN